MAKATTVKITSMDTRNPNEANRIGLLGAAPFP